MRNFDIKNQFEEIKKAAVDAIQAVFPVSGKSRVVEVSRVWVEDTADSTDYLDQAKSKSKEGTWGVPVYAALTLKDKATGEVIDKSSKTRLFLLPKSTARWSYIVKGNEYQVHNQLRLKSGVYTLKKQNGELKTSTNLALGKNYDILFKESSGIFTIAKVGGGQSNIPLYSVLTHLGLSHSMIERSWGKEIAAANKGKSSPRDIERAKAAFGLKSGQTLSKYFDGTKIDPKTTKTTIGKEFDKVSGPMLLASAKKLLEVHLGKKKPEDRDSLEFKELWSLEDFIKERLDKNRDALVRRIKRSVDNPRRTKIAQIVNPGAFNSVVESFFTQDDKSSTPEQTNPLEMLSGQYKATIMGAGGINSEHAVTPEMREVHPSHYGFMDPIHTPESKRIGANLHLPLGVMKDGKQIKSWVTDKKGKSIALTPVQAREAKIVLPGQRGDDVKAYYRGKVINIKLKDADYFTPAPQALFSWSTNMVPFLPSNQGNRSMMAAKMLEQAISLKHREAPLVQVGTPQGSSFEKVVGSQVAATAPANGVVKRITKNDITIETKDGPKVVNLYDNFSLNRKSFLNHEPTVKVGDKVVKGQIIADSNYTKGGTLALGTNLKAAYIPYKGLNFEDGLVITDKAAEKLTSAHIHKKTLEVEDNIVLSISAFKAHYPNALSGKNISNLDSEGIIKKGSKVNMGDAVIAALQKRKISTQISSVRKQLSERPKDISLYWGIEDEGTVIDIQKGSKSVTVFIKTEEKAKIGDKLSGRMGNKGIITKIISNGEAPRTADGEPVDILLNPHGVISRINIGQIYESAAGKVAKKTGKVEIVQNFTGEDYLETTNKKLKGAGISDKEELFDANTGKSLGNVHVGNPYILKLFKQSTGNFSTRQGGPGQPYDLNAQPLKAGGDESAKSLDLLSMYSMLSHGARANLREMSYLKSNKNDEYWKALKSGQMLPPPESPFAYKKFLGYLKGAGIDVRQAGSKLTLAPLTDKDVLKQSSGEVEKPVFYRAKDMDPIKGGFFDHKTFGGLRGEKWGHLELKEESVNPVFEGAVRKLTGLGTKFDKVMSGKLHIGTDGKLNSKGDGITGGAAIKHILDQIDVDKEIETLSKKALGAKKTKLDDINKKLRYLKALKKNGLSPSEAYIRKVVPIAPPIYRPVYSLPDGSFTSSDVNFLYQNLGVLDKMSKLPVMDLLPEDEKSMIREDLYKHMKGVSGLTDLNIKGRKRAGFISEIKGKEGGQPKEGFFISKVLSKRQDFVGRGTIIPEPTLGVDEVALPKKMAWKVFEPFVIRELGRMGKTPNQALDEIKEDSALARKALEVVMRERKVLLNRAPSLHKFSIMAFKPKITSGTAIKIPPLIVGGFNADFDGDTMTVHVPISDEANREADKMLPSQNLFQPGTGKLMMSPSQEAQVGLYYLSKTPQGRAKLNKILGNKHKVTAILNKSETKKMLSKMVKSMTNIEFGRVLTKLKAAGEDHAYGSGFTLGLDDIVSLKNELRLPITNIDKAVRKNPANASNINLAAIKVVDSIIKRKMSNKGNSLYDMVDSGARGSASQLRSIVASPLFVTDARGRIVPDVIKKSYAEGLDIGDYWTSMYGARRGMMDRAIQTSLPGAFSKDIMANTIDNVITKPDCGVQEGSKLKIGDPDILDRYLATNHGTALRNTLVDQMTVSRLKRSGIKVVEVRSPLSCLVAKGTCQKCYGLDENGSIPDIGDNIGAKSGQALSEPLVQLVMNCSEGHIVLPDGSATSFIDYYEGMDIEEKFDGHCYSKHSDLEVKDCGDSVPSNVIQHHPPDDEMLFIKTKNGHMLLVQANHPIWVYDEAGNPSEILAEEALKGRDCLRIAQDAIYTPADGGGYALPKVDPYFIGRYLADGCMRYGNGTKKYEGIPVATVITGADIEIKEKTAGCIKESTNNPKNVQIYSLESAKLMLSVVRGRGAKKKRLQPGFNTWSPENLEKVLAGFLDGDSSVFVKNGCTVAQVYTSSYLILQQIEIICSILGIKFTPQVVTKRPLQKSPAFVAQLRFYDENVRKHSIKMQRVEFFKATYPLKNPEYDMVTYIKPLWSWDLDVWDIKTETKGFTCGMVRNHNTFHTGGTAGDDKAPGGYQRIDQLLKMPKVVSGAATLSPKAGRVSDIKKGIGGGYDIYIDGTSVHVARGLNLKVRRGSIVERGDALSEGIVKPQDLVQYKGMRPAQEYMVNELKNAYGSKGVNINRKTFETVIRSLANTTQVINNPKGTDFVPGDIIPYTTARAYNKNLTFTIESDNSEGFRLAKAYGPFKEGFKVKKKDIKLLKVLGHKEVLVTRDSIQHAPLLKSINTLPLLKKDWMSALGYRNLSKALVEGAGQAWETDLEGHHPIPAFAHGATFGQGKDGRF